eukprot:NODE_1152_length_1673_cov_42.086207_g1022_i0.p1 GENE.NODE_1152_length_1673_cov_42.086207_g1022_i0~~NODE_1152_length_1673_cov_42.086207_g1022_i0.p1  ORF type:complete len:475 (+),score=82.17 NODE_1152_length_1673_cov_42.086207_g1022_i0:53-1477(+)
MVEFGSAATMCIVMNVLNAMFFGYALIGISSAAYTLWRCLYDIADDTPNSNLLISVLFTIINVGGLPYGLFAGYVMNSLGRRRAVAMGATFACVGSGLSIVAHHYVIACIARIITGVGIGALGSTIPVYIQEMAPIGWVGTFQAIGGPCVPLTIFLGNVIGFIILGVDRDDTPKEYCILHSKQTLAWKNMQLLFPGFAISFIILILAMTHMPESTAWLATQDGGQGDEEEEDTLMAPKSPAKSPKSPGSPKPSVSGGMSELRTIPKQMMIGLAMGVAMQLTGINAVMFYAPRFLVLGGVKEPMLGSIYVMAWNLLTSLIALSLIDRMPRRVLLLSGLAVMAVALMVMHPIYNAIQAGELHSVWCFVLLFAVVAGFELGPGMLFGVIVNEVLPSALLATASPVIGMSMGTMAVLVTFVFPPMEFAMGSSVFFVFGGIACAVWSVLYVYLPETRGRSEEEILREIGSSGGGGWTSS